MEGDCIRDGMAAGVDVIHVLEQEVSFDIARDLLHYLAFQAAVSHSVLVQESIALPVVVVSTTNSACDGGRRWSGIREGRK